MEILSSNNLPMTPTIKPKVDILFLYRVFYINTVTYTYTSYPKFYLEIKLSINLKILKIN